MMERKAIVTLFIVTFFIGCGIITAGVTDETPSSKEDLARRLVVSFKEAEADGSIIKEFRSYEEIVNYMIEDISLSGLEFKSLEREGLEMKGITSGVICEYCPGNWVVITNEIIPDADYHSGPAAMVFTTTSPSEK